MKIAVSWLRSQGLKPLIRKGLICFYSSKATPNSRPSFAPKPSYNLKHIRQNPDLYRQNCIDRNYKAQASNGELIASLYEDIEKLRYASQDLRKRRKQYEAEVVATLRAASVEETSLTQLENVKLRARELASQVSAYDEKENDLLAQIDALAADLPNLTSQHTPIGNEPRIVEYINEHPDPDGKTGESEGRQHVDIGIQLDLLDFASASTTSGWGWYYLKNEAAMLEQALIQYAIGVARSHGFGVVSPPSIVYSHISSACGFKPRDQGGEQQVYPLKQPGSEHGPGKPELCLAGTAEIPFAAMKADAVMQPSEMPLRVVGASRCYRAEAGARGVDTKGLYRVHEFTKVEMFGWTLPDGSENELFGTMLAIQKTILGSLGLHCRVLEQPSFDLGASATRKRDIETYFPSRASRDNGWGELTSTSICTDYQTRNLNTRLKVERKKPNSKISPENPTTIEAGKTADTRPQGSVFPYTVNGTAMAVPRVLAAILETHWNPQEKCVRIPEVLWPWMQGIKVITKS
jgi:seryl-tRNA synthetase